MAQDSIEDGALRIDLDDLGDDTGRMVVVGPMDAVVMAFGLIVSMMADSPEEVAADIQDQIDEVGDVSPS